MEYNFRGIYSSSENYIIKDVVSLTVNNVTNYYFCLQPNSDSTPQSPSPNGDTQYWGLINALSNFPNSIDTFITRNPIQNSDKPRLQRFQELSLKSTLTTPEQNELAQLTQTLRDKLILPEDWNKLQQSISNIQMFFQTEIMLYWQSVKDEINQTKDDAIQAIEAKRVSIINYLETTEVGELKNDVGDLALLQTDAKDNLKNAVNEVNTNSDKNSTDIGTITNLTTTNKSNLVNSVNEVNAIVTGITNTLNEKANFYVPSGLISMWSGSISNIPVGWRLCDGANGTPDLRNRFIVGAGTNYSVGNTGGSDSVTLNTNQIPSHSHGVGTLTTSSNGSHSHSVSGTTSSAGEHTHNLYAEASVISGGSNGLQTRSDTYSSNSYRTAPAGLHTHTFSGYTDTSGGHSHSISGNTANSGSGQSHENRPPYYALAYIMKL